MALVASPTEFGAAALQSERRQCDRHRVDFPVIIIPSIGGSGEEWRGRICDLSRSGAMVVASRRFEKNTILNIRIINEAGDDQGSILAGRVRTWTQRRLMVDGMLQQEMERDALRKR